MEKPQLVPSFLWRMTVLGYCNCRGSFCQNIQLGIKFDAPKLVSGPWNKESYNITSHFKLYWWLYIPIELSGGEIFGWFGGILWYKSSDKIIISGKNKDPFLSPVYWPPWWWGWRCKGWWWPSGWPRPGSESTRPGWRRSPSVRGLLSEIQDILGITTFFFVLKALQNNHSSFSGNSPT